MKRVILASKSPRREELLGRLVDAFEIEESGIDEESNETDPDKLASRLAKMKTADVFFPQQGCCRDRRGYGGVLRTGGFSESRPAKRRRGT